MKPQSATTTLHIVLGMWLEGGGFMFTEAVAVTDSGYESLSTYERELIVAESD